MYLLHNSRIKMELKFCELCKSDDEKCNGSAGTAAYLCFVAGQSPQ